jgi:hypothetical protein
MSQRGCVPARHKDVPLIVGYENVGGLATRVLERCTKQALAKLGV